MLGIQTVSTVVYGTMKRFYQANVATKYGGNPPRELVS
jgi:hypothetical protein